MKRSRTRLAAASLIALPLWGCGVQGPPEPHMSMPPIDMHADLGKIEGSAALAGPAGWTPAPTQVIQTFPVPAPQLFAAMQEILLAEPRTWQFASHPEQQQASFIVRSAMFNLPDVVVVQAVPVGTASSNAVILSRSRYDVLPLGNENGERVQRIVRQLIARFGTAGATVAKP